jgi:hypothetical protein
MIAIAVTLSIKFYTGWWFWSAAYAFVAAYHNFKG